MLLHGFVGDVNIDWVRSGILDLLLDEDYRVIAFDARGHGLSDKPHELCAPTRTRRSRRTRRRCSTRSASTSTCSWASRWERARHSMSLPIDPRIRAVVALGLGENTLQHNARGMNGVADAMLTDDPDSIEHESLRHFREMADAIHADREALAALMAAERTEVPDIVDNVKVPVLS